MMQAWGSHALLICDDGKEEQMASIAFASLSTIGCCPSCSKARSWPVNRLESDEISVKLKSQAT